MARSQDDVPVVRRDLDRPLDRWEGATASSPLEELVHRSNLLGADRALANFGGGNTSVKASTADHAGRATRVLWVKGSGSDLATLRPEQCAGLRLDDVLLLRDRAAMTDTEMVDFLRRAAVGLDRPRPSIESLLHAFLPALHVDHTHPDAIIALTASPNGRGLAAEAYGDEALWVDYQRPGFALARLVAQLVEEQPTARAVLLEKHGLVTWGETSEGAYRATLEFVTRGIAALESAPGDSLGLGGVVVPRVSDEMADQLLLDALPVLRGALLEDSDGIVLEVDRSAEAVAFASSARAPEVSQIGAPCPDHLVVTKHKPLALSFDPRSDDVSTLAAAVRDGVRAYGEWYQAYYDRHRGPGAEAYAVDPVGPRVVLVPGVGIVTAGSNAFRARLARDLYRRAIVVEDIADSLGGFASLSEAEAFAIEYWPLERYKLSLAPAQAEFSGRIAFITGGASGIGRATAQLLARHGAHVVVADRSIDGAREVAEEIVDAQGLRRAIALEVDVRNEDEVANALRRTVLEYGGVDILVASAGFASSSPLVETTVEEWDASFAVLARGYFLAARETFKTLISQGRGGSIVFVASKNALVAGTNVSAYSSAKAAALHLARCLAEEGGAHGIRVNVVNPDAVISGSSIWSSQWKTERASTYGIDESELESFYQARTKLGVAVLPEDVAEAVAFFAGPRSRKSTGNLINVDGGVTAAYPR